MRRRVGRVVAAVLVMFAMAACGVRAQGEPEILRSPPPAPTATPTSTEQPTTQPTGTAVPPSPTG